MLDQFASPSTIYVVKILNGLRIIFGVALFVGLFGKSFVSYAF